MPSLSLREGYPELEWVWPKPGSKLHAGLSQPQEQPEVRWFAARVQLHGRSSAWWPSAPLPVPGLGGPEFPPLARPPSPASKAGGSRQVAPGARRRRKEKWKLSEAPGLSSRPPARPLARPPGAAVARPPSPPSFSPRGPPAPTAPRPPVTHLGAGAGWSGRAGGRGEAQGSPTRRAAANGKVGGRDANTR